MCNKRRTFLNYNPKGIIYSGLLIAICGLVSCSDHEPVSKNETVINDFPKLSDPIPDRDEQTLLDIALEDDSVFSDLAWKALAKTEIEDLDGLIETAIKRNDPRAWFALSYQSFEEGQLERLTQAYLEENTISNSVCDVFYRQGGVAQFDVLLTDDERLLNSKKCALAAGGIVAREEIEETDLSRLTGLAFRTEDKIIQRNLLYGFYRGSLNRPERESSLYDELLSAWKNMGIGNIPQTDQYLLQALGTEAAILVMGRYSNHELEEFVQLSVELARVLKYNAENEKSFRRLLNHTNPHVVIEVLGNLATVDFIDSEFLDEIEDRFSRHSRNAGVFLASLNILHQQNRKLEPYRQKLNFIASENPYLTNLALEIYRLIDSGDEYLDRLEKNIALGEIQALHGVQALTQFWMSTEGEAHTDRILEIVMNILNSSDRSAISGLSSLLSSEELIRDDQFESLEQLYSGFKQNGEDENAMVLKNALESRFPNRFEDDFEPKVTFRIPDWQRLYELGIRPLWTLETDKGTIQIELNPLSAPFTVSSIDSLTRAGYYDEVVFHRVVRNFVVQGGDFERRDGFGGPDYTLPTEPSFQSYERGAVGIASSGTDTEGSQYFIMHQWAPHLDGNYTLFGQVVRGMDVVDRIQVGDRVVSAEIYNR